LAAITEQHMRSQAAFFALMNSPADTAARRELHRAYREATAPLLELQRRQNESGTAPSQWDLETVAQPLVQQTMIEADLVDALGQPEEAEELRDSALAIATTYLSPGALARVQRERAVLLALEGRFNEALTALADIRRGLTHSGDVIQAAQTALEEASVLDWLGDNERALRAIQDARELVEPRLSGRPPGPTDIFGAVLKEAVSIFSGGGATGAADETAALWRVSLELVEHEARIHKAVGEFDDAERLFKSVLSDYVSLGPSGPGIEYQLAAIDVGREHYGAAHARLALIEAEFTSGLLRPRRIGLRSLQADVALGLNQPEAALALADDGIADLGQYPDEDLEWKLHWRRGRALAALARADEALGAYGEAAAVVDSLRKSPLGYRLDSTYLRSKLPLFDVAIDLAAERRDGTACARFIELVKARALSSALSIPPQARGPHSELELEFDRVTQRLDALEYQGYRGMAPNADVQRERVKLLGRRLELIEQIRLRDPRWRGLSQPLPFEPGLVATRLAERDQAALTLYVRNGRVVSVLVAGGEIAVATHELAADSRDLLEQYAANLLRWQPDPYLLDLSELGVGADSFIPPALLERAVAANSLLIAPHRTLHLLPWPALTFAGQRLFEQTAVGIVPNLTCTSVLDADFASKPRMALAGTSQYEGLPHLNDLPATALELDELADLYKNRLVAPPAIGRAATERAVRALAARADADGAILHVSCHGTLSVEDPLGSGLLLVDGKVDSAELARTTLHYEEVVLSACSTGWRPQAAEGIELTGDDILGLPGALLEGGARSIVVSIPKAIDEVTRQFMVAYHGRREVGATPLVAFRDTQRELLGSEHEPYKWTGIVCYAVC
jgi:CHAT domain-containing protein/tetratricopeptide (TPR) repeat protein